MAERKKKKKKRLYVNDRDSTAPGEGDRELVEYKDKMGLPKWNDLSREIERLSEKHGVGWADELKAKIDVHRKYVEYQTLLAQNYSALGLQHVNVIHNVVDLQNKIFVLEEKLRSEGRNPLESSEWVKARELLMKEMQFIHKHGLDEKKFQHNLSVAKKRSGDDDLFVVEEVDD